MNVNKVFIAGNITSDITLKSTPTGQDVTSFGVATNNHFTDKAGQKQTQTEFHNVVVWGAQAKACSLYLKKGDIVHIEGRLQTRKYTDKSNIERKATEIVAERVQFGPRRDSVNTTKVGIPAEQTPLTDTNGDVLEPVEDGGRVEDLPF